MQGHALASLLGLLVAACSEPAPSSPGPTGASIPDTLPETTPDAAAAADPVPVENWSCDLRSLALHFDVASDNGHAEITFETPCRTVSLDVAGLSDLTVRAIRPEGAHLVRAIDGGRLDIASARKLEAVAVTWSFQRVYGFDGLSKRGSTVLWPDSCGNLFPCHPSMSDGATYTITAEGAPPGQVVVHPGAIPFPAPAYMPALAIGDYAWHALGKTKGGLEVGYWTLPSTAGAAAKGTAGLLAVMQWYESTLGSYAFGTGRVGPVPVDWGLQYGGLENHPFWHVSTPAMGDLRIHAHEAAHGWYGSGVRLACWEDLVMSEGTADYLAARALGAVQGSKTEDEMFDGYLHYVALKRKAAADRVIWPGGCGEIDVDKELLHQLVYKKGALFWRDVGDAVGGRGKLDAALGSFYRAHRNRSATMKVLLAHVRKQTKIGAATLQGLEDKWLLSKQ